MKIGFPSLHGKLGIDNAGKTRDLSARKPALLPAELGEISDHGSEMMNWFGVGTALAADNPEGIEGINAAAVSRLCGQSVIHIAIGVQEAHLLTPSLHLQKRVCQQQQICMLGNNGVLF